MNLGLRHKDNDTYIYIDNVSGVSFAIGLDNSDSGKLKISGMTTPNVNPSSPSLISFDSTLNGDILVTPNGTGVTNSNSLVKTPSISFDAGTNIIANYFQKTSWVPVLTFGGGSTGITYTSRSGYWSQIGNIVFLHCHFLLSSKGTDSGIMNISGYNGPNPIAGSALDLITDNLTAVEGRIGFIDTSGNIVCQTQTNIGGSAATFFVVDFTNTTEIIITGSYLV